MSVFDAALRFLERLFTTRAVERENADLRAKVSELEAEKKIRADVPQINILQPKEAVKQKSPDKTQSQKHRQSNGITQDIADKAGIGSFGGIPKLPSKKKSDDHGDSSL